MNYLVDKDWLIDTLRGIPTAATVLETESIHGLSVSFITLGEIYDGIYQRSNVEKRMSELHELFEGHTILGLSDPIMQVFAQTRLMLRRRGQLISDLDILIASTAIVHDLTLITRNLRHFQRIPDLKLYPSQDDA